MHFTRQFTDAEMADRLDEIRFRLGTLHPEISRGVLAEAAKRLRSGVSKTIQQHKDESVLARYVWPIKQGVASRLQAVSHEHRHSFDILQDAAYRGVDDAVRAINQGEQA